MVNVHIHIYISHRIDCQCTYIQKQIDDQCTYVSDKIDDGGWKEAGRRLEGKGCCKDAGRRKEAGRQPYIAIHTHTCTYMHIYVCIYRYQ